MAAPVDYRRLSLAAKQAVVLDRQREPAVTCPRCETHTTAADLLAHLDRCEGQREPHPRAKWLTWGEARKLVLPGTLSRWVQRGAVRIAAAPGAERRYLLRDLALRLAERRGRREFPNGNRRRKR